VTINVEVETAIFLIFATLATFEGNLHCEIAEFEE
jgi:hypothetical protein